MTYTPSLIGGPKSGVYFPEGTNLLDDCSRLSFLEKYFDLYGLLEDLSELMQPAAVSKGLQFIRTHGLNLPRYVGSNAFKTKRILIHLIANAIQFTHAGHIGIHVRLAQHLKNNIVVQFIIEDTGIGISNDQIDLIFQLFNHLPTSIKYDSIHSNPGQGLQVVKQLLDDLEGEAHVESQLNQGSIFKVLIPCTYPHPYFLGVPINEPCSYPYPCTTCRRHPNGCCCSSISIEGCWLYRRRSQYWR